MSCLFPPPPPPPPLSPPLSPPPSPPSLQYTTMGKSLPKVELRSDMCAVCGQRIEAPTEEGRETERTYRLTCGHLYPLKLLIINTNKSVVLVAKLCEVVSLDCSWRQIS